MSARRKNVLVVYYSMYGHVQTLARQVVKGLERAGVNARLYQISETLPDEVLQKMYAAPKAADVPIITPEVLAEADGVLFGIPTRFGMLPAQMKAFFDACGQLWMKGAMSNKFVGVFFSTGSLNGGQETTVMSTMPFFAHMGMIYVPMGNKNPKRPEPGTVYGGSPWGAGTIAGGDGSRQPTEYELETAEFQGFDFGSVVRRTNF